MFTRLKSDEDLKEEAKNIVTKTKYTDNTDGFMEGMAFRVLKLEQEVSILRSHFWSFLFVFVILPIILRAF